MAKENNSNNILTIVQGISDVISQRSYDGAKDENGEPVKIGLKREEGCPINSSRQMDGFKVKIQGDRLQISYQTDILLKDVYGEKSGKFEDQLEDMIMDISKFIKKEYRKFTGKTLSLKPEKEIHVDVQSTSRIRNFVIARKWFQIGGIDVDEIYSKDKDVENKSIKKWLNFSKDAPHAKMLPIK